MQDDPPNVKLTIVFSEQAEFKGIAKEVFHVYKTEHDSDNRLNTPDFEDMKTVVPLQAADIVAYEFYKEVERRQYRPEGKPRYGYEQLVKMALRVNQTNIFRFNQKADLLYFVRNMKRMRRQREVGESPDIVD